MWAIDAIFAPGELPAGDAHAALAMLQTGPVVTNHRRWPRQMFRPGCVNSRQSALARHDFRVQSPPPPQAPPARPRLSDRHPNDRTRNDRAVGLERVRSHVRCVGGGWRSILSNRGRASTRSRSASSRATPAVSVLESSRTRLLAYAPGSRLRPDREEQHARYRFALCVWAGCGAQTRCAPKVVFVLGLRLHGAEPRKPWQGVSARLSGTSTWPRIQRIAAIRSGSGG